MIRIIIYINKMDNPLFNYNSIFYLLESKTQIINFTRIYSDIQTHYLLFLKYNSINIIYYYQLF